MKLEQKHIETLIIIGNVLEMSDNQKKFLSQSDFINRLTSNTWLSSVTHLSNNQIIDLFKGIVFSEKILNWLGGSVAGGIWIYKEIQKRKLDKELTLANWAIKNTNNGYIPFGTNGLIRQKSKNATEFYINSAEHSYEVNLEKISKDKRLLEKKILGQKNKISKLQYDILNLKIRLQLAELTGNELAEEILKDNSNKIYFYYNEILKLIIDNSVSKSNLKAILNKFEENKNKKNNLLKNKLIEAINK